MNFDKFKNLGFSGLANLGNTCFINSTLQPLLHTYELTEFLNSKKYVDKLNKVHDSLLLVEWDTLSEIMMKTNKTINPTKFVNLIHKISKIKEQTNFTTFSQNDLPEFFIFLIDCFHNAITRKVNMTVNGNINNETDEIALKCFTKIKQMYENDYSEIWKLFYGTQITIIENNINKQRLNIIPEPFSILNLPIPPKNELQLEECFDLYVETETMSGENAIKDDSGNILDANKQILFWSFPEILVIDIKRFNSSNRKNMCLVHFPLTLDLSKYVIGYNKENYIYDLYAVCNHSGSVLGGHYTSFVKNANGNWYHYNDTLVKLVDVSKIVTPQAYCFFYRKQRQN
jgi:ubiquitin C-terminal hydrolase